MGTSLDGYKGDEAVYMKATIRPSRVSYGGNALMEYVLPAALIMLSSGLILSITNATDMMTRYYLSCSGRAIDNNRENNVLNGETFTTHGLADRAVGNAGNGFTAFGGGSFADLIDGSGASIISNEGGTFYLGDMTRRGPRPISSSPEYLYP